MASFSVRNKRTRCPPSPSDCSMEDPSDVAIDGASLIYGVHQQQAQPSISHKMCTQNKDTSICAAVSPFADFRTNSILLSQSSTASSVTFDSSKMELDSLKNKNRSGTIFDSVCFISAVKNHDNSSSVSMDSPMRDICSPVRKKIRCVGKFEGDCTGAATPERGVVVDTAPVRTQDEKSTNAYSCHVCGNAAADCTAASKSATGVDSFSARCNITTIKQKQTKSHSLLDYFAKSKVSTKKPMFKSPYTEATKLPSKETRITCHYCDKLTCNSCIRQCEWCTRDFCTFCSKVDYGGVVEKILCFECCVNYDSEKGGSDVDMMDI